MAASITVHLQIFKRPQLLHFSTDLDETGIKNHGLLRSFILNIVIIRVAVPIKTFFFHLDTISFFLLNWAYVLLRCVQTYSNVSTPIKHTCRTPRSTLTLVHDSVYIKLGERRSVRAKVKLSLVARKPVFGVSDKESFKPVSSATETS